MRKEAKKQEEITFKDLAPKKNKNFKARILKCETSEISIGQQNGER
jgi:hypothetical protein